MEKLAAGVRGRLPRPRPCVGGGAKNTSGLAASPLLPVGGGSLWNTLTETGEKKNIFSLFSFILFRFPGFVRDVMILECKLVLVFLPL